MVIMVIMAALRNIIDLIPRHHLVPLLLHHPRLIGNGMDTMGSITTAHHRLHHHLHTMEDIPGDLKILIDTILLRPHLLTTLMTVDHHHPMIMDHLDLEHLKIDLHLMAMVHHHRPRIIMVLPITLRRPLTATDLRIMIMDPLHHLLMNVGPHITNTDVLPHHQTIKDLLIGIMIHLLHHLTTILLAKGMSLLHQPHKISDNPNNRQIRMETSSPFLVHCHTKTIY
ncbi:hypothetical protein MSG28_001584 [Choristoneura fumiferana]|uniref:Uncharacterized protein n=1 Tax=Choristoneura fumiferana TaxID=7141 RepID=A0ACC0KV66_CHOFU|nr:hypothetical protein MSG28_001584 [Choristoneura fumiferana]